MHHLQKSVAGGGSADSPLIVIGDQPLRVRTLLAACAPGGQVVLTPAAMTRIMAARMVVDRFATGPEPVYGLNTGLGGNLSHRVAPAEMSGFQEQLIRARTVGVGPLHPEPVCRAALLCRIAGMAAGGSGISPPVLDLLLAMFNASLTPAIPGRGSIGASDLGLAGHMGAVVIGRGQAWFAGRLLPGREALTAAGLVPATLAPKDGLSLLNSNAVTSGHAAMVIAAVADFVWAGSAVSALSLHAYGGNPGTFDARVAAARPAAGQVAAAALFRRLLDGIGSGRARAIQDALCFRVLPQVTGVVLAALGSVADSLETEINAAGDNPLVLIEDGAMLSTANFHTPGLALALDTLAIALCQAATASFYRVAKMMTPALSGLPRYLSPSGGASAGLNPLQKTAAALHAEIRLRATPASLDALPVSDTVEDHAPHTPLCVRKLEEQLVPLRFLVAIEAVTASQAMDLRDDGLGGPAYAAVRSVVPRLDEDREAGPDVDKVEAALFASPWVAELRARYAGPGLPDIMS